MNPLLLVAIIVSVWLALAVLVAVVLGRAARAGEHERQLAAMRRELSVSAEEVSEQTPDRADAGVSTRRHS